jgi:hypothetical protein
MDDIYIQYADSARVEAAIIYLECAELDRLQAQDPNKFHDAIIAFTEADYYDRTTRRLVSHIPPTRYTREYHEAAFSYIDALIRTELEIAQITAQN